MFVYAVCFFFLAFTQNCSDVLGESFSSIVSSWEKRSSLAQSLKNAVTVWSEGVRLFSTDLHPTSRHSSVEACLGLQRLRPEMDNKACKLYMPIRLH